MLLAGAAKTIAVRDRWIGWSAPVRLCNLPWVVNNSRFPIFPHVRIPHLASQVLGQLARRLAADWPRQWGFAPLPMEAFVDPRRVTGTCYRAAGWQLLGQTSGRGLARPGRHYRSRARLIPVKPLRQALPLPPSRQRSAPFSFSSPMFLFPCPWSATGRAVHASRLARCDTN